MQGYWNGLPCPPPGDLPDPGIKLVPLISPALAGEFFTTNPSWAAQGFLIDVYVFKKFLIEVYLTYSIIVVSSIQHSDSIFLYVTNDHYYV